MQVTIFEFIVGLAGLISLGFNIFQLYKDRINRQRYSDEQRLHQAILRGIMQGTREATKSLEQLRHKGADGSVVADTIAGILNTQRIELEEFLNRYHNVGVKQQEAPPVVTSPTAIAEAQEIPPELIQGIDAMTSAMIEAVENAKRYVFCIGGRSRNDRYLNCLRQRVLRSDVRYIRVISGDHIRHQLHEHIRNTSKFLELGYLREDKYGGILVTHDTVILAIYSSSVPALDKGLRMVGEQIASDYRSIVQDLFNASEKPVTMDFISGLCTMCTKNGLGI